MNITTETLCTLGVATSMAEAKRLLRGCQESAKCHKKIKEQIQRKENINHLERELSLARINRLERHEIEGIKEMIFRLKRGENIFSE